MGGSLLHKILLWNVGWNFDGEISSVSHVMQLQLVAEERLTICLNTSYNDRVTAAFEQQYSHISSILPNIGRPVSDLLSV